MYVIILNLIYFLAGNKLKLVTRLTKFFLKNKKTDMEVMRDVVEAEFIEHGNKLAGSNHKKISQCYSENFNGLDKFNE